MRPVVGPTVTPRRGTGALGAGPERLGVVEARRGTRGRFDGEKLLDESGTCGKLGGEKLLVEVGTRGRERGPCEARRRPCKRGPVRKRVFLTLTRLTSETARAKPAMARLEHCRGHKCVVLNMS